jgi:succinate dehydrogenase / fumarate reductase cytochrome b subunit
MRQLIVFLNSSIGRKMLMGATGLLLIGFLVVHMSGNLLMFVGADAYNRYSHTLVSNPLIYVAELGLLFLFVAHLVSGIIVHRKNLEARPQDYDFRRLAGHTSHKSIASTTMIVSGIVVLVFVPVHLWKFKLGTFYPSPGDPELRDLHRLVVEVFQNPLWVTWYVFAMVIIGFHLWHGFGSAFESLGVSYNTPIRRVGQALAVVLALGFLIIPVALYMTGGRL